MSYLPYESKTYKEVEESKSDTDHVITFNNIPVASALVGDKTANPHTLLRHYHSVEHDLPKLPGPSVLKDIEQAERLPKRLRNIVKEKPKATRRQTIRLEEPSATLEVRNPSEKPPATTVHMLLLTGAHPKFVDAEKNLMKKSGRKAKKALEPKPIDYHTTPRRLSRNVAPTMQSVLTKRKEKTPPPPPEPPAKDPNTIMNQCTQCNMSGGTSKKEFVIPRIVRVLLQALSFLMEELRQEAAIKASNAEDKDLRRLTVDIEMTLAVLCTKPVRAEHYLSLDSFYTYPKKLEKLVSDIRAYIDTTYGPGGKLYDGVQAKRNLELQVKEKTYEVEMLTRKLEATALRPKPSADVKVKVSPEVDVQNNKLEIDQLRATIKFNEKELTRHHRLMAQMDTEADNAMNKIHKIKTIVKKGSL